MEGQYAEPCIERGEDVSFLHTQNPLFSVPDTEEMPISTAHDEEVSIESNPENVDFKGEIHLTI